MRAGVHIDIAPDVRRPLERHDDALLLRQLDDFHRIRRRHQTRTARRQTVAFRVVLGFIRDVVVVHRTRPRHERHLRLEPGAVAFQIVPDEADYAARARQIAYRVGVVHPQRHVADPRYAPNTLFTGDAAEIRRAVGKPWHRVRRRRRRIAERRSTLDGAPLDERSEPRVVRVDVEREQTLDTGRSQPPAIVDAASPNPIKPILTTASRDRPPDGWRYGCRCSVRLQP